VTTTLSELIESLASDLYPEFTWRVNYDYSTSRLVLRGICFVSNNATKYSSFNTITWVDEATLNLQAISPEETTRIAADLIIATWQAKLGIAQKDLDQVQAKLYKPNKGIRRWILTRWKNYGSKLKNLCAKWVDGN